MNITKIQDSFNDQQSRADQFWTADEIQKFYKSFRKPMELPKSYLTDNNSVKKIVDRYHLRGFQFGNWVTNEDRFNYLASFYICFYDLNKVLKFKNNNLGLSGSLGIALGSRGIARALAHYEPVNEVINISRYKREDVLKREIEAWGQRAPATIPKEVRFLETGGIGSFAHEYGHFLDGTFGMYTERLPKHPFLTGPGKSINHSRINYPASMPMRNQVEDIFEALLFTKGKNSNYRDRLLQTESDYLNNRQEIFARLFEQYISYKLETVYRIQNSFMTKKKYQRMYYLSESEMKKIAPMLDKLVNMMQKHT